MRNVHAVDIGSVAYAGESVKRATPQTRIVGFPSHDQIACMVNSARIERNVYVANLVRRGFSAASRFLVNAFAAAFTRSQLEKLSDRMLVDIGINPADVRRPTRYAGPTW